jgi:hypothetical protein
MSYQIRATLSGIDLFLIRLQPPTNPQWARVVGYGPFSLWVIHKEGLCPDDEADDDVLGNDVAIIIINDVSYGVRDKIEK